jgi:hypothetical protein
MELTKLRLPHRLRHALVAVRCSRSQRILLAQVKALVAELQDIWSGSDYDLLAQCAPLARNGNAASQCGQGAWWHKRLFKSVLATVSTPA